MGFPFWFLLFSFLFQPFMEGEHTVHACMLGHFSCFQLLATPWTIAHHDPMDCSPPGSSTHWILQTRILEWVAIPSSRGSSWLRDRTLISSVSWIGRQVVYHWCHLGSLSTHLAITKAAKLTRHALSFWPKKLRLVIPASQRMRMISEKTELEETNQLMSCINLPKSQAHSSGVCAWDWPRERQQRLGKLSYDLKHSSPLSLTPKWCMCGQSHNFGAKALKIELTSDLPPTGGQTELAIWT